VSNSSSLSAETTSWSGSNELSLSTAYIKTLLSAADS